jgi:hypothetical protein
MDVQPVKASTVASVKDPIFVNLQARV